MTLRAAPGVDLLGLTFEQLGAWLDTIGVGSTHAGRVFRGLHVHEDLSVVPSLGRHARVVEDAGWRATATIVERHEAPGGVTRVVFALFDGKRVEGVLLPNPAHPDRVTLCLSSQVGCAMACRFCATGTLKLARHLFAGEIVAEVQAARKEVPPGGVLTHLVFMGMGEPLHNYDAVRDALSNLFDQHGVPFDRRKVTLSTVGLLRGIEQFGVDFGGRPQLALSLHAGTDAVRRQILPMAKAVSMAELHAAVKHYASLRSSPVMVEYVVLPGVNDTPEELDALSDWMTDLHGVVNLIPFNPFPGSTFETPTVEQVNAALVRLRGNGTPAKVRWPRGREASGACGQLMLAGAV